MSWFESLVVQPIFNILMALYSLLPGNDFGLALILFAIVVRVAMWPLIKRQLHQTKLQRAIQPELKKIKQKAAGDRQLEGQLMLELYRERGISMTAPLLPLFVQLPVFIALYQVIMMVSNHREKFDAFLYGALKAWEPIAHVLADTSQFNEKLLGLIDLTRPVIHQGQWYWPALVLAVVATAFQWYQSKQITPAPKDGKKLRDVLRSSAVRGEPADQAEMSAALGQGMLRIIPVIALTSMVMFPIPGALLLFYATSSIVAVWQQRTVLVDDVEAMEVLADEPVSQSSTNKRTPQKAVATVEAEVVERQVKKPVQKRRKGNKVR